MIDLSLAIAVMAVIAVVFFIIGQEVHRHAAEKSDLQDLVDQLKPLLEGDAIADKVSAHCAEVINNGIRAHLPTEERFKESVEAMVAIIRAAEQQKPRTKARRRA